MINFLKSKKKKNTLEISTQIICKRFCDYCPQNEYKNNYIKKFPNDEKVLTFSMLEKVSKNIPQDTDINWTGFTEPLDFKDFDKSVTFFGNLGYNQKISTTLSGREESKNFYLKNLSFFSQHTLHLPDDEGLMKMKVDNKYLEYVENIIINLEKEKINYVIFLIGKKFHIEIQKIINKFCHGEVGGGGVNRIPNQHSAEGFYEKIIKAKYLNTRNSKIDNIKFGLKKTQPYKTLNSSFYCSYQRLNQAVLLPNGLLALCCQDYSLDFIVGDLKKKNLIELYNRIENDPDLKKKFIEGAFFPCTECEHYKSIEGDLSTNRIN